MNRYFYKLYHPDIFQGHPSKEKYFEGWYFKLVDASQQEAIAVIPGIAIYDAADRHAFIQVIDGIRQTTSYYRFPVSAFKADDLELKVAIGDNFFSKEKVVLDVPQLKGEITLHNSVPLRTSLVNPGIMGWYSFMPRMQCYHGVVSLHHQLKGQTIGELGAIEWSGGVGYIEKDWGTSFPKCWIWMHSNHFSSPSPASLMASVAHIPWMGSYFPGFIVVVLADGHEYRFTTYNSSKMKCTVLEDRVLLEFKRGAYRLRINAWRGPSATLRSPITGQMTGKVNESLQARLDVVLSHHDQIIWKDTGTTAGLEVAGDTTILESGTWRR